MRPSGAAVLLVPRRTMNTEVFSSGTLISQSHRSRHTYCYRQTIMTFSNAAIRISSENASINEISCCNDLGAFAARHYKQIIVATDDGPGVTGYCAGNELIVIHVSRDSLGQRWRFCDPRVTGLWSVPTKFRHQCAQRCSVVPGWQRASPEGLVKIMR